MEHYKMRMVIEYRQLIERITKLEILLNKAKTNKLDFELSCPIELLEKQLCVMNEYREILIERATIEGVKL